MTVKALDIDAATSGGAEVIMLPGRSENPAPEAWDRVVMRDIAPGGADFGGEEVWVRNVSVPALIPVLPDPAIANGTAMIVAPGGAYMGLSIEREGFAIARWLNGHGIAAYVLKYRTAPMPEDVDAFNRAFSEVTRRGPSDAPDMENPLARASTVARDDMLDAVRVVRERAGAVGLRPDRIGLIGFSAGAVSAVMAVLAVEPDSRPDLVAILYGILASPVAIPATAPPAFVAVAADDAVADRTIDVHRAWRAAGRPSELHVFGSGSHGFGAIAQGAGSDQWLDLFANWLRGQAFLP